MNVNEWYKGGQFTSVNGLKVYFRRSGEGEPLVCIHGFPSSSWDFEKIWSSLISRFDTFAPDLIGLGKSDKPKQPLPVSLQADIIEALLIQEDITNAHILAHDLGDTVAQELLARQTMNSSQINWKSCIFMNGGIFPETHRPLLIQKILISSFGPFVAKLMSKKSFEKNMRKVFSQAHPPSDEFIQETWNLINENEGKSMIPRLIRYMQERVTNRERWVKPLSNNVVPILLINGTEDPISGKHMADRFSELVPNADSVLLENSGHYPHLETPEMVSEAIFRFHDRINCR
ncbi:MAG: alpha/beta fold hydrolase [Robiginitalea sp.]|jgi:pimeloyl-ACP methyl ester carboxylesterase